MFAGGSLEAVLDATRVNQRGVILWRDEPEGCFAPLPGGGSVRALDPYPVTILGALEPDRLPGTLHRGEATVAARFLYAVPAPPPFQPLAGRKPAHDDDALALLRAIRGKAGTMADPLYLHVDDDGVVALDRFLGNLHADLCQAEGLLAAWLGKGRGVVPKLACVLHLLDWSARQMFDPLATVNACEADRVLARLTEAGVLRPIAPKSGPKGGRMALRWEVNPALGEP